ncbi:hypothetical protein CFBP4996_26280 (plasmid) [Agrobacterium leguminum]|uniref:hypothetical protein n=1 Tax=Agrobacterium leguminum TaxID=2792015 RepID=UPI0010C95205|nr:hypothetical protein [Agrobacterium leguminum]WFS69583.1 hypothetical protein CFBP4996_26280 [Agrobacterium leguminum]
MSGTNAKNTLLLKSNLVLIERVVHATRTVIRDYRVELTPFREGQLVSAVYEEMVTDGALDLSYEEVLRRVEEMFRVSKWKMEAKEAEDWPGPSPSWMMETTADEASFKQAKFWSWLEGHRRGIAWFLAAAAIAMAVVIVQILNHRWT